MIFSLKIINQLNFQSNSEWYRMSLLFALPVYQWVKDFYLFVYKESAIF